MNNAKLKNCAEADIINKVVHSQRLRSLGYIERLLHQRVTKVVMIGKRRRGRPRRKWLNEMKEILKGKGKCRKRKHFPIFFSNKHLSLNSDKCY